MHSRHCSLNPTSAARQQLQPVEDPVEHSTNRCISAYSPALNPDGAFAVGRVGIDHPDALPDPEDATGPSVLQLGASGARTTEANQHWRVALLEDLTEAAGGLAEELEALQRDETAVLSAADASDKAWLIAAVLASQLREIDEDCAICTDACQEPGGGSCSCLAEIGG